MLKKPSTPSLPAAAPARKPFVSGTDTNGGGGGGVMQVESTHVHVLADGKKMIDVTLRRPEVPASKQFDDESDDSSSSDSDDGESHRAPVYNSPLRRPQQYQYQQRDGDNLEDSNNNSGDGLEEQQPDSVTSFQDDFKWDNAGVNDIQQLTNANTQLVAQATEFKRQIKLVQIQLEALTPVPGLNPEMVQDILLEREGAEHDIRDAKIVYQAKTLRHLKRTLQREKQLAVDAVKQCKLMETAKQQLEKEVETLKLKAARFQARAAAAANTQAQFQSGPQQPKDSPREPASQPNNSNSSSAASDTQFKKKFDDLKVKNDKLQSDFKKLQRALQREVGDNVSIDEILESADGTTGKRGRAQQIVMLKAKVKKLEAELASANSSNGAISTATPPSNSVDLRAQQELVGQQTQKQRLLDKLTLERDEMQEKLAQLTKKYDGIKSRTQTLEKEKHESKAKFQLLVDKSKNDDALIDALQRQLATWKTKVQEVKRVRTAESVSSQLPAAQLKEELERLRSMVAEYKRQQGNTPPPSHQSMALSSGMPVPSEASQYRTMALYLWLSLGIGPVYYDVEAEKERLQEVVKGLQSQLEERERELRQLKQQQPSMMPSMLPALSDDATAMISRIPRKPGMPALGRGISNTNLAGPGSSSSSSLAPQSQNQSGGDAMHGAEIEALRRTFRESLRAKEGQIAALTNRLHDLETTTQQQQQQQNQRSHHPEAHVENDDDDNEDLAQEVQDLQEENQFLRQEFEKFKTRYEALVRDAKSGANGSKAK